MPLQLRDRVATVSGVLTVDEVEPFVTWLRTTTKARVDLRRCTHLHTGALQALIRFGAKVTGTPEDAFLAVHVLPLLVSGGTNKAEREP